jgi:hypothetical protein
LGFIRLFAHFIYKTVYFPCQIADNIYMAAKTDKGRKNKMKTEIVNMTPVEIDTHLSEIWERANQFFSRANATRRQARRYNESGGSYAKHASKMFEEAEKIKAKGIEVLKETAPYDDEFTNRGGWNRYFLVHNVNGHIHREQRCSTCRPTTEYVWLIDLADCDEKAMVAKHGEKACTVCFPDAPTMEGYNTPKEVDPSKCQKQLRSERNGAWVRCFHCSYKGKVSTRGYLRTHKFEGSL